MQKVGNFNAQGLLFSVVLGWYILEGGREWTLGKNSAIKTSSNHLGVYEKLINVCFTNNLYMYEWRI